MSNKKTTIEKKLGVLLGVKLHTVEKHTVKNHFKECYAYLREKEDYEQMAKLKEIEIKLFGVAHLANIKIK